MGILTAKAIQGFSESILGARYDEPKPTPAHHLDMWELCTSEHDQVAIAAPRGSAKSTAVTFAYLLATVFFKENRHVLILSANEELAALFLSDIKTEIIENETLRSVFGFKKFIKERETEIVVELKDGYRFRIIVKGAQQRLRGLKWDRARISLVIPDDLEDEELVESEERRRKFRRWFYGAVKPILRKGGRIRMVGTIIHMDSLLNRFMPPTKSAYTVETPLKRYTEHDPEKLKLITPRDSNDTPDRAWHSVLFRAHDPDFSQLLWPEMFPEERLRKIRADFAEQDMLDVYGQEYLNNPIDDATSYFRRDDFIPMHECHFETHKTYYAAGDLAITANKKSAYTVFVIAGIDSEGVLNVEDVRRGRWDSLEISDEMFSVQIRWSPDTFRLESENIAKSIGPFIYNRMGKTVKGVYQPFINIDAQSPTKDKIARSQSIRAMMRAGKVRFNKEASWYPDFEEELIHFPKWPYKDQVDSFSWLGMMLEEMVEGPTNEEYDEDEWEGSHDNQNIGACSVTGY